MLVKDYEVGHCKPPKKSQFKKGQSGCPTGKPKGTLSIKTIAKKLANSVETWEHLPVLNAKQEAIINAIRKKIGNDKKMAEGLILAWILKALNDSKFAGIILELLDGKAKTLNETEISVRSAKELANTMQELLNETNEEPNTDKRD